MPAFMSDLFFVIRKLIRHPVYTMVSLLLLALTIGSTTAVYSTVDAHFLNPVPDPLGRSLIQITEPSGDSNNQRSYVQGVTPPVLKQLRENEHLFHSLTWLQPKAMRRMADSFSENVSGAFVSPDFFAVWDVQPQLGRVFENSDAVGISEQGLPAHPTAIILSHLGWKRFFQGDPSVIGKLFRLENIDFTVVGIMPKEFRFPSGDGSYFWLPIQDPEASPHVMYPPVFQVFARLKPSISIATAQAMLNTVAAHLESDEDLANTYQHLWAKYPGGLALQAKSPNEFFTGRIHKIRPVLFSLLAAICFVLIIACLNLANLTLVRIESRRKELALRAALGAGRGRLLWQILLESLVIAFMGGLLGLVITHWGIQLLTHLTPPGTPSIRPIGLNANIFLITAGASGVSGILVGLLPAIMASRRSPTDTKHSIANVLTPSPGQGRFVSSLVVIQVALAVLLMTGAGLMIRTVANLLAFDPGYESKNLLTANIRLPREKYGTQETIERRNLKLAEIHARLATIPSVESVGIKNWIRKGTFRIDLTQSTIEARVMGCGLSESDLFHTLKVPLKQGRLLTEIDKAGDTLSQRAREEGTTSVVINQAMAVQSWPGESSIGKTFGLSSTASPHRYQVVGIVGDMGYPDLRFPTIFHPYVHTPASGTNFDFVLRSNQDAELLIPSIRTALKDVEPGMLLPKIVVDSQQWLEVNRAPRTLMAYLTSFAAIGLFLGALGVYGILSHSVAQRTREIGIRMAIGAGRLSVMGLVLKRGFWMIGIGSLIGILASTWLTKHLHHLLFQVHATDPIVIVSAFAILVTISLAACLVPALRAGSIAPMTALRSE